MTAIRHYRVIWTTEWPLAHGIGPYYTTWSWLAFCRFAKYGAHHGQQVFNFSDDERL